MRDQFVGRRSLQLIAMLGQVPVRSQHVIGQAALVQALPSCPSRSAVDRAGVAVDRPAHRGIGFSPARSSAGTPEPPVGDGVAKEQATRLMQLREDLRRHYLLGRAPAGVVDVVIFRDHEVVGQG